VKGNEVWQQWPLCFCGGHLQYLINTDDYRCAKCDATYGTGQDGQPIMSQPQKQADADTPAA
jgi:tRNA(Ile2) C34 agmatinyltransferase TiaS